MYVAVDQPWSEGRSFGINGDGGRPRVHICLSADCGNSVADGDHCVSVENRTLQVPTEHQTDVSDHQLGWIRRFHRLVMSH